MQMLKTMIWAYVGLDDYFLVTRGWVEMKTKNEIMKRSQEW